MIMKKRNCKKGSAMVTTILVILLVCALVATMLTLSMYDTSLAKVTDINATRMNQLDMLTDLFLKYNTVPSKDFGFHINVYYYENGNSTMTVRMKESSTLCEMIVEQRNGELIKRIYNAPYYHTESVCNRTIGIHNEVDAKPMLTLTLPKSMVSANGPFYIYGKIKLERAIHNDGGTPRVFVNLQVDNKGDYTVMTLNDNTDGWVNLQKEDGTPLKFDKVPSTSLKLIVGMDNTSGDVTISDLVVVNNKGTVCYSLANDATLNAVGDVRAILSNNKRWSRPNNNHYTTEYPISTQDPDNYLPKRVLSLNQPNYVCNGETFIALYKSTLRDVPNGGAGYYYITGRVRTTITGRAELCDKAGDSPTAMLLDVHGYYDHDNDELTPDFCSAYPSGTTTNDSVFYATSGCWSPLLNRDGGYYKFYVPADCERSGEDYIKFTLWAAMGSFDVADIRVYKLPNQSATPNPSSDICVYNMEADNSLSDATFPNCDMGGERKINDFWSIHWLSYQKNAAYADKLDYTKYPGDFTVSSIVNPIAVNHLIKHYVLPVFPNKIGQTYKPQ